MNVKKCITGSGKPLLLLNKKKVSKKKEHIRRLNKDIGRLCKYVIDIFIDINQKYIGEIN